MSTARPKPYPLGETMKVKCASRAPASPAMAAPSTNMASLWAVLSMPMVRAAASSSRMASTAYPARPRRAFGVAQVPDPEPHPLAEADGRDGEEHAAQPKHGQPERHGHDRRHRRRDEQDGGEGQRGVD